LLTGACPRAALTTASAAAAPITTAVTEEEDLDKKVVREWKKEEKRGRELDKPRFPNTPVGTFGRRGGATRSHRLLGPGRWQCLAGGR
jgi:hypothetical protein